MKENIPLQSIDFRCAMQEINESPKERERREKELRQIERAERREKIQLWVWRAIKALVVMVISATVYYVVGWLLSKCLK